METKERIMPDKAVTLIDLDDIIRTRAGKKAKYIPGFLINGLKRLIHQDSLMSICVKVMSVLTFVNTHWLIWM